MRENTNKLIFLLLAVVALAGAYTILMRNPKTIDEKPSEDSEITLSQHEIQDISSVSVQFPLGKMFSVNVKPDGEIFSYELLGGMDGTEYDQSKLESLVTSVASLKAKEVEANRDKIKEYGLDAVSEKIEISYTDGKKDTVTLGMDNGTLGAYMLYNEEQKIYLLSSQNSAQMKAKLEDYRSLTVINGISDITSEINRLCIDKFGQKGKEKPFEILRRPANELSEEKANYYSAFVMKQPRQTDAVDDNLVEKIFKPLTNGLYATEIIEDFPKDLSIYGLNKPVEIQIETETVKKTLLIGNEKDGSRFAMVQGGNTVFKVMKEAFAFLENDYRDYCTAVLWTHNIKDIQKMTVQYDDEIFETVLKHGENDLLTAETNGKPLEEEKARKLFSQIISVRMEDELDTPAKAGDLKAKLTLTYTNGKEYDIRFIKGASRQFIASVNGGKYTCVINTAELDEIMEFFK